MSTNIYENCTAVTPDCPTAGTTYGYAPSLGFNAFFLACFAIIALIQFFQAIRYKTAFYGIFLVLGCSGEAIGYGGRIMMHSNPWSTAGFEIQIACLIFSPAFVAAGIYITLKNVLPVFGGSKSRVPAKLITWVFICCDFLSLFLQAAGGGVAASANDRTTTDIGTDVMIAGIAWQVFTLIVFAGVVAEYAWKVRKSWHTDMGEDARMVGTSKAFWWFVGGLTMAFTTVFVRCVYRLPELSGGWGSAVQRDEAGFIGADGFMVLIAAVCLTAFHPGRYFSEGKWQRRSPMKRAGEKSLGDGNRVEATV